MYAVCRLEHCSIYNKTFCLNQKEIKQLIVRMHCKCYNKTCFVQMTTLSLEQLYFVVKRMTGCSVSVSLQTLVGSYQPVCLLWCNENNDAWTDTEPTAAVPLAVPTAVSKLQNRKYRQSKCFLKILTLYLVFVMLLYERSRTEQTYNPPVGSDRSEVWCVSRQFDMSLMRLYHVNSH